MVVGYTRFVRQHSRGQDADEIAEVDRLADRLRDHLERHAQSIDLAHVHRASSKSIQDIVGRLLTVELAFTTEVVMTPTHGFVSLNRPDFFYQLARGRGVIAEVERGGTTTNNHDLKDMWKAHIAPNVQHLFLIVPHANWKEDGTARERPYRLVSRRLGAFFGSSVREIDVESVHIFGYGSDSLSL